MTPRMQWLDSLRALAAVLVLVSHIGIALRPEFAAWEWSTFNVGHVGVVLFFLISGYIIPRSLSGGQRQFWARRALRLLPLYWLVLAYQLASADYWPSAGQLAANLAMVPDLAGAPAYVPGAWTLGIELVWYGLAAALVRLQLAQHYLGIWAALAALGLFADGVYPILTATVPPPLASYLPIFWAGYVIERWASGRAPAWLAWGMLVATLALVTVPPPPRGLLLWANEPGHIWPRVLAFAVFGAVVLWGRSWRWPRWLVWSGERCYGIYLIHGLVIAGVATAPAAVLWVVGTLGIADMSWRYIEQPAIRLGRIRA